MASALRIGLVWTVLLGAAFWWVRSKEPPAPVCPPELEGVAGVRLFYRYECGKCHKMDLPGMEGKLGPPLRKGFNRSREYLEESLRDPGRVVVQGYLNVMPSYAGLAPAELAELIEYLEKL